MRIVNDLGKLKLVDDSRPDLCGLEIFTDEIEFACLTAEICERFRWSAFGGVEPSESIICDAVISYGCLGIFDYESFADESAEEWFVDISSRAAEKKQRQRKIVSEKLRENKHYNYFVDESTGIFDELLLNTKARVVISCSDEGNVTEAYLKYNNYVTDLLLKRTDKKFQHNLELGIVLPAAAYEKVRHAVVCGDLIEQLAISVTFSDVDYDGLDIQNENVQDLVISSNLFCQRQDKFFFLVFPNWIKSPNPNLSFPGAVSCIVRNIHLSRNRINIKSSWHKEKFGTWDSPKGNERNISEVLDALEKLLGAVEDVKSILGPISKTRSILQRILRR